MIDVPDINNIKPLLEILVQDLNILNNFCMQNDISFTISADNEYSSSCIGSRDERFMLGKVKQTKVKEL